MLMVARSSRNHMDAYLTVPIAAHLTGLSIDILRDAIATGALRASLGKGSAGIEPYHITVRDLASWCHRCGYTHLWANPNELRFPAGNCL